MGIVFRTNEYFENEHNSTWKRVSIRKKANTYFWTNQIGRSRTMNERNNKKNLPITF